MPPEGMSDDELWAMIGQPAPDETPDDVAERLAVALRQLPPEQIFGYLVAQERLMARSYTSALWGAAYLMNGGCSDDGFDYFRGWLLGHGRAVFERAVADPDSLAELDAEIDEAECEAMIAVALDAYHGVTGTWPSGHLHPLPTLSADPDFDDDREMRARYPRLFAKYR